MIQTEGKRGGGSPTATEFQAGFSAILHYVVWWGKSKALRPQEGTNVGSKIPQARRCPRWRHLGVLSQRPGYGA